MHPFLFIRISGRQYKFKIFTINRFAPEKYFAGVVAGTRCGFPNTKKDYRAFGPIILFTFMPFPTAPTTASGNRLPFHERTAHVSAGSVQRQGINTGAQRRYVEHARTVLAEGDRTGQYLACRRIVHDRLD